jgi:hypothetical protein
MAGAGSRFETIDRVVAVLALELEEIRARRRNGADDPAGGEVELR